MRRTKKMLAMDGGGIRGILPAMRLAELERRAQPPVCALEGVSEVLRCSPL
jgi:hypothetical protein